MASTTARLAAAPGFFDGFFDRVIAVHVLAHLPKLPAAIRETCRLLH
jgi:hypothetical protein